MWCVSTLRGSWPACSGSIRVVVLDPQLHTHAVIANRVKAPDGRWLAFDARTVKMDQRTLSSLYHAGLRAELTRRLGVALASSGELGSPRWPASTRRCWSSSRNAPATWSRGWRRSWPGSVATWSGNRHHGNGGGWNAKPLLDSRPAKNHTRTAGQLQAEWRTRLATLGFEPHDLVVTGTVGRVRTADGHRPADHARDGRGGARGVDGAAVDVASRRGGA